MTKFAAKQSHTLGAREQLTRLEEIPNVGPATAGDLRRLGVQRPPDLRDQDGYELYDRLCQLDGIRYDPCVIDVFLAAVDYMNGGPVKPWWKFTPQRKRHLSRQA